MTAPAVWGASGPLLVALGALLWSLDSLFRSRLVNSYSPFLLVFLTQLVCAVFILPACWVMRKEILRFEWRDWAAFLFLALASNILAMAAFTYAFAHTTNFSAPILIQKLQPLISVLSAALFLKEKLPKRYFLYVALAMSGSFLVTFGSGAGLALGANELFSAALALVAALFWGLGTTIGRYVSLRHSFWLVTSMRYGLSVLAMLLFLPHWLAELRGHASFGGDVWLFLGMALVPGLLALAIYYRGMQSTRASVACWMELAYPVSAIVLNWVFLGSRLSGVQLAGGALLIGAVTFMSLEGQE